MRAVWAREHIPADFEKRKADPVPIGSEPLPVAIQAEPWTSHGSFVERLPTPSVRSGLGPERSGCGLGSGGGFGANSVRRGWTRGIGTGPGPPGSTLGIGTGPGPPGSTLGIGTGPGPPCSTLGIPLAPIVRSSGLTEDRAAVPPRQPTASNPPTNADTRRPVTAPPVAALLVSKSDVHHDIDQSRGMVAVAVFPR